MRPQRKHLRLAKLSIPKTAPSKPGFASVLLRSMVGLAAMTTEHITLVGEL